MAVDKIILFNLMRYVLRKLYPCFITLNPAEDCRNTYIMELVNCFIM